ncbi:hypothetical protein Q1W73_00380 [Asticcacaulis sp. ZE23SCel15]|uniref:hypothetical protein n=1 Tax=Asticcacaulis sp. ZE23SCel15 TaxID=3059027 RepID=UPI00266025DA|nr:hypothetical protein [Asticcacaulis sp. ZE23SCel15]WKL57477.1 hypothetical protein Q1W73_00380 [Asticcacaulis sp. ZE23SCel15]
MKKLLLILISLAVIGCETKPIVESSSFDANIVSAIAPNCAEVCPHLKVDIEFKNPTDILYCVPGGIFTDYAAIGSIEIENKATKEIYRQITPSDYMTDMRADNLTPFINLVEDSTQVIVQRGSNHVAVITLTDQFDFPNEPSNAIFRLVAYPCDKDFRNKFPIISKDIYADIVIEDGSPD